MSMMKGLQLLTISVLLVVIVQAASGMEMCNLEVANYQPCVDPQCCSMGKGDSNGWCSAGELGEQCGGVNGCGCRPELKCVLDDPSNSLNLGTCKCNCDCSQCGLTGANRTL